MPLVAAEYAPILLVGLHDNMGRGLADPVHRGDMLRDKPGNLLHIPTGNDKLEIICSSNKAEAPDLAKPRDTLCNPVVPVIALRTHFEIDDCKDFAISGLVPVDYGDIPPDHSCVFKCANSLANLILAAPCHHCKVPGGDTTVLLKHIQDLLIGLVHSVSPQEVTDPFSIDTGEVMLGEPGVTQDNLPYSSVIYVEPHLLCPAVSSPAYHAGINDTEHVQL